MLNPPEREAYKKGDFKTVLKLAEQGKKMRNFI